MPPGEEDEQRDEQAGEDEGQDDLDEEDEQDGEEEGEEDEPTDEVEEEPERPYIPPVVASGEDEDDALLREGMSAELYEAMMRKMRKEMASEMQTMAAANIHVTAAAAEHPELFRTYGTRIQATLSELPAATRSRPESVHIAIARIVMEDGPTKGLGATLRKLADMAEGIAPRRSSSQAAPKPKAPIPVEQRPPSPSGRGRDVRPLSSFDRKVDLMMKDGGLTREQARVMVNSGEV